MDGLQKLKHLFPRGSKDFFRANETETYTQLQDPHLKPNKAAALDGPVQRKEKSLGRTTVRFNLCRVRPLDPDNATGSVKDCVDGLCRCGLIPGDDPTQITLIVKQTKVGTYSEEQTDIEITYPE
jgi:hypothetical protein